MRDKQIVYKMSEDSCPLYNDGMCNGNLPLKPYECRHNCGFTYMCAVLYGKGYRKASDVAREIFEEIEKITMHNVTSSHGIWLMSMGEVAFAELKKKYTEG